jgi:hypothetical protein
LSTWWRGGWLECARDGVDRRPRSQDGAIGQGAFEALDALEQRDGGIVGLGVGQLDQRDLEVDALIRDVAHLDLSPTELFEGAHQRREPHTPGGVLHPSAVRSRQAHELARHDGQEPLAEILGEVRGETLRVAPCLRRMRHGHEGTVGIAFGQGFGQLRQHDDVVVDHASRGHLIERR